DLDVAVADQLPAAGRVLRRPEAREDGEARAYDQVDVAAAAVDHRARDATRLQRRHRQLAEVRGLAVARLVDGDVPRRNGRKHVENLAERRVVVGAESGPALDRIGRAGKPRPL